MIRHMYALVFFLVIMIAAVAFHYLTYDHAGVRKALEKSTIVTGMACVTAGAAWFEPRLRRYERALNPAYPELMAPDRPGFVYGEGL